MSYSYFLTIHAWLGCILSRSAFRLFYPWLDA